MVMECGLRFGMEVLAKLTATARTWHVKESMQFKLVPMSVPMRGDGSAKEDRQELLQRVDGCSRTIGGLMVNSHVIGSENGNINFDRDLIAVKYLRALSL